jgi:CBS domain-containing membrane protein
MGASAVLLFAVPASPLARSQPTNTLKTHDVPSALRAGFNSEDVDAALADLGEAFDIERDDIDRLLERVALRAMSRHASDPLCADIMSQDLITIGPDATLETARALLIEHNMRTLPVLNTTGHLLGSIDLRDLSGSGQYVRDKTRAAVTAHPTTPAAPTVAPPKSAPAARTAKSLDCSKQADAKSMHGKDRRKFMEKCKRS